MNYRLFYITILLITSFTWATEQFDTHLKNAYALFKKSEYTAAIKELKSAEAYADSDPNKALLHNSLGWIYYNAGDFNLAQKHLEGSLLLSEKISDSKMARKASNNLGVLEYSKQNFDKAEFYFTNTWTLDSKTSLQYIKLIEEQRKIIKKRIDKTSSKHSSKKRRKKRRKGH
ncbi:MAG: hypothetical protein OCD76_03345 [Reichenbachiella sp.]